MGGRCSTRINHQVPPAHPSAPVESTRDEHAAQRSHRRYAEGGLAHQSRGGGGERGRSKHGRVAGGATAGGGAVWLIVCTLESSQPKSSAFCNQRNRTARQCLSHEGSGNTHTAKAVSYIHENSGNTHTTDAASHVHEGSGNTHSKGSVFATKTEETHTHGRGSCFPLTWITRAGVTLLGIEMTPPAPATQPGTAGYGQ